jgi:TetR/AcrR family tetracycline transcriptional repressor
LRHAGFTGALLVAAYNSVIVAMVGFPTQEFGPVPREETQGWREETKKRLRSVSSTDYPVIVEHMSLLQNKAFILRWDNGTDAPMTTSFEVFVNILIAGLESLLVRDLKTDSIS